MTTTLESVLRSIRRDPAFEASATPTIVVDPEYRIRTANSAFADATLQTKTALSGAALFEVFPDNPETPDVHSVAMLTASLEQVFAERRTDYMAVQRYDVRDPASGGFLPKTWLIVNAPITGNDGEVLAVLHQAVELPTDGAAHERALVARAHAERRADVLAAENANLTRALQSNRQIGMAIGIVMATHRVTEIRAFEMLRQASASRHAKLADVAAGVVHAGRLRARPLTHA